MISKEFCDLLFYFCNSIYFLSSLETTKKVFSSKPKNYYITFCSKTIKPKQHQEKKNVYP